MLKGQSYFSTMSHNVGLQYDGAVSLYHNLLTIDSAYKHGELMLSCCRLLAYDKNEDKGLCHGDMF
ncbi:hypothetical protein GLYMA_13G286200v4 [Glycine max]|uniref:Uncharacterized protein n=1 Tax=Glycine max TaxID=3847 RepID=A0A0R0GVD3_SOYBN|nr:hypothetical protein GYH30_037676 [Glycine max]KRH22221.1 hypothetical protein GLYMA_13G286200v4 [Glycine max]